MAALGLEFQLSKCGLYVPDGVEIPAEVVVPEGLPRCGQDVEGEFQSGFLCWGVPVGSKKFVAVELKEKVEEVKERAERAVKVVGPHSKHSLWNLLQFSIAHQMVSVVLSE